MTDYVITEDDTDVTIVVHIVQDAGATSPGEPLTGLLFSDIETGGSASYARQGATRVDFTLVTQTVAGAHTDGGFIEIDATNMPGDYRLDIPDAVVATGVNFARVRLVPASANNSICLPINLNIATVLVLGSDDKVILSSDAHTGAVLPTVTTLTNKTGFSLSSTGLDAIVSTATGMVEIAKAIWDRVISKANHDISNSAGKKVRQIDSVVIRNDTAQGSGTGNNQIQFDTGASAVDGSYDPSVVSIIAGTGAGQSRMILEYNGGSKTATVDRNWKVNPDSASEFIIVSHPGREHVNEGLAQAGTSTTITLNALASSTTDAYKGQIVFIRSGTGDDQARVITAYNGTTKVATVEEAWDVTPNTTSAYVMLPSQVHTIADTQAGLATETKQDIIDGVVDAILVDTNELQSDDVPGLIASLNNLSSANVLTQVNAALDTAISELGVATPSATPSTRDALMLMYMALRNKTVVQTSGTDALEIHNNAGTKIASKLLTDVGGDYTEGKMS